MQYHANAATAPSEPSVSVVVPCYKSGRLLEDAVRSILDQNYSNVQVVIVSQGGDWETESAVRKVANWDKVEVIERPKKNAAAARNAGIRHSRGRYVAFLDADDLWEPGFLQSAIGTLLTTGSDCVFGETEIVNERLERLGYRLSRDLPFATFLDFSECPVHVNTLVVANPVLEEIGGFDEELPSGEDWDFLQRLTRTGRVLVKAKGAAALYRFNRKSTTAAYDDYSRKLIEGVLERAFSIDERCVTAVNEFKYGIGRAHYHLEAFARRIQVGIWTVLEGHMPTGLATPKALLLHWYRHHNAFESVFGGTISRYYRVPLRKARPFVLPLIPTLAEIIEQEISREELNRYGLVPPKRRLEMVLEPELTKDVRRVLGYMNKAKRKYLGFRKAPERA